VKGPQSWILAAALGCFAAGMTVGLVAPGVVDALAGPGPEPDPDVQYVRRIAADFGLSAQQERSLSLVVQARRQDQLDLLKKTDFDLLPDVLKNQLKTVRRKTDERIRYVLTPEQRERYDREARPDAETDKK
jgi:hypothetical protein